MPGRIEAIVLKQADPGYFRQRTLLSQVGRALLLSLAALSSLLVLLLCACRQLARPPDSADRPAPSCHTDAAAMQRRPGVWTFLLTASDQSGANADTIMVCTYDTVRQRAGLVSLPRDTLLRSGKLNAVSHQGIPALRDTVSDLLGIPIDHCIALTVSGFREVVDAVGGISFSVPVHMAYDDPSQNLSIHFEPGMQHLTGAEALLVARCRKNSDGPGPYPHNLYDAYPDADVGRTRTQQKLAAAVIRKALAHPGRLPQLAAALPALVRTDLSAANLLWLAGAALSFDFDHGLSTATLSGNGHVSYRDPSGYFWGSWCYELDPQQTLDTVNRLLNPYDRDLRLSELNIFQVSH